MTRVFETLDRLAAGKHAKERAAADAVAAPRTRRTFAWVLVLLVILALLAFATLATAWWLSRQGEQVAWVGWMRGVVALAITLTLFYFWLRARAGLVWAWSRLTLFAKIFPLVTLAIVAIPDLYPAAMVSEQIVFAMVLLVTAWVLDSRHMRAVFVPAATAEPSPASVPAT